MSNAEALLSEYIPPPRSQRQTYSLKNMSAIMQHIGNPQDKISVIHVAGTSGKTSTCYYLASLLRAEGYKVGLTVSPHVEHLGERIQINGRPLDEDSFITLFKQFKELLPKDPKPTYFEILIAFAYWYFEKEKVDVAVIETGIGGLLDGTNVVNNPKKICVITDIGIDHTQILGDTITEIAAQKAGIIHQDNRVFMLDQGDNVNSVFSDRSIAKKASLSILSEVHESDELPLFQNRNFSLARQVVENFLDKKLTQESLIIGRKTYIPGRMEVINIGDTTIVLDGAHNPQKLSQFVKSFKAKFPDAQPILVTSMLKNGQERITQNTKELAELNPEQIITTGFQSLQDIKKLSVSPEILAKELRKITMKVQVERDPQTAFKKALELKNEFIVVTGSLYLVFELHALIIQLAQQEL